MVKSVFLEREGATPKNKVTDFLIVHSEFDYSLKDIARFSEVSYACMKHLKKELVKGKWIVLTRKIGRAQMYKLDINNKKVQKFVDFYWAVVDEEVEKHVGFSKSNISSHLGPVAMPISAKGFQ